MKAIFAHDHIFRQDSKGNYYTAASFNNEVWKRYLKYFSSVSIVARLQSEIINAENTYNDFNLSNTSFVPVPSLSGPIAQIKNKKKVYNTLKDQISNADVLIARLPSEIGNLAITVAKEINKPYIIEVVACVWDALWNYGNIQGKLYAPIALQKMKKRVKNSPFAIYVTNEFLQKRYPCNGRTESISNVEIADVSKVSLNKRIERYNSNNKLVTIGMIGSLDNKIKGLDVALKALKQLNEQGINFNFQVLGAGDPKPWKEMIRGFGIEDKVEFRGLLPGGEPVLKWLDDIDIYIQPSYQEGLPRAVIEAMSRGCPVIGSAAGGIPELINKNCVHATGNAKELSQLLLTILNDIPLATLFAEINSETAKEYLKNDLEDKRNRIFTELLHH